MLVVRRLGLNPLDDVKELSGEIYHSDPTHYSFDILSRAGIALKPVAEGQLIEDGVLLVPRCSGPFYELLYIVDRLLGPGGCPWDIEQTHQSLKKYLLEETYEVFDAIDSGDPAKLQEELGDLLLQPLMHSQIEARDADWGIDEVAGAIREKLVRRHPHVFGNTQVADSNEVLANWDQIKQSEKGGGPQSILEGIPKGMASLLRAHEVSKRAARVGFEWPDLNGVFDKFKEEEAELREAIALGDQVHIESEVGDLLFTVVNLARWVNVEPEEALRRMLNRFTHRFQLMEACSPVPLRELSEDQWDDLWKQSKIAQSSQTP
ncbi:MAG: nucleoside triphosphate pyrophosphohydrolase [Fimbriimonadaceae bacterium]|nr:nucleoside triphosphate pyrophosphohydrolase [Fimbriimonadaceae bacterium]